MSHHWDYGPGKTKSERRSRKEEKKRERMEQGKKAKLWAQIIQERARKAEMELEKRKAEKA